MEKTGGNCFILHHQVNFFDLKPFTLYPFIFVWKIHTEREDKHLKKTQGKHLKYWAIPMTRDGSALENRNHKPENKP